jgi:plastocyanin
MRAIDRRPVLRIRRRAAILGPTFVALIAMGLLSTGTALAQTTTVEIPGLMYTPASVTIHVGDAVTWTNTSSRTHTATSDDGEWDTSSIGPGTQRSQTFNTAGTFGYHCAIHPSMEGTIVVLTEAKPVAQSTAKADAKADAKAAATAKTDTKANTTSAKSGSKATSPATDTTDPISGSDRWPGLALVALLLVVGVGGVLVALGRFGVRQKR